MLNRYNKSVAASNETLLQDNTLCETLENLWFKYADV